MELTPGVGDRAVASSPTVDGTGARLDAALQRPAAGRRRVLGGRLGLVTLLLALASLALVHRRPPARSGSRGPPRPGRRAASAVTRLAAAHGSRRRQSRSTAVRTVKSPGRTCSSSSQVTGNDTGTPGRDPRAVGRDDGRATRPGRVDEHLAAALLADERRGGHRRVEPRGAGGDAPGSPRRRPGSRRRRRSGTNTCTPLAPLVLTPRRQPGVVERLPDQQRGRDRQPEPVRAVRRRPAGRGRGSGGSAGRLVHAHQRRVVLDRPLVGEPDQGPPVVADRVAHLALGGVRPRPSTVRTQSGVYFGRFFCMNGCLAEPDPDDGQRRGRGAPGASDRARRRGSRPGRAWSRRRRRTAAGRGARAGHRPASARPSSASPWPQSAGWRLGNPRRFGHGLGGRAGHSTGDSTAPPARGGRAGARWQPAADRPDRRGPTHGPGGARRLGASVTYAR